MVRARKQLLFFIGVLTILSCKKEVLENVEDYYPDIVTSATLLPDGHIALEIKVENEGASPVKDWGFCYSEDPNPELNSNQIICGSEYKVTLSGFYFPADKPYYFCSWAINDHGYVLGNVVKIENIEGTGIVVPCAPSSNTAEIVGLTGEEDYLYISMFSENKSISTYGALEVYFHFSDEPKAGIYTTTLSKEPGLGYVRIFVEKGALEEYVNPGAQVYVSRLGSNSFEINVCESTITLQDIEWGFRTNLQFEY